MSISFYDAGKNRIRQYFLAEEGKFSFGPGHPFLRNRRPPYSLQDGILPPKGIQLRTELRFPAKKKKTTFPKHTFQRDAAIRRGRCSVYYTCLL